MTLLEPLSSLFLKLLMYSGRGLGVPKIGDLR
jgi:hypothetical protein